MPIQLTACQNVEDCLLTYKEDPKGKTGTAWKCYVCISEERSEFKPMELSGGQAGSHCPRFVDSNTKFILGDEPTGPLDTKTSVQIMELFKQFNEAGKTIVINTHEHQKWLKCARKQLFYVMEILNTKR